MRLGRLSSRPGRLAATAHMRRRQSPKALARSTAFNMSPWVPYIHRPPFKSIESAPTIPVQVSGMKDKKALEMIKAQPQMVSVTLLLS